MTKAPPPTAIAPPDDKRLRKRRWRRIRWTVRGVVLLAVIGYLKFVGLDSKFYYPDDVTYVRPEELGVAYEDVTIPTTDGLNLHGWFLPARGSARGTILHFHGNAANVTNHLPLVHWLPDAGYHVLMFDYRGYGRSEGRVTRAGTIRDGHAALDYALARPDVRGRPVFAYGQSLGGAVAIAVAADRPEIAGVIAESTFSSYRGIAALHVQRLLRFGWVSRLAARAAISGGHDPLDVVDRIAPRPLLLIAAECDEICYPEGARELYERAGEPKELWIAPGASHLAILEEHPQELPARVKAFLERNAPPNP